MCLFSLAILFYLFIFKYLFIYLFIYLAALGLSCGMRDLVPWPGIESGPPALGAQSLSHWTTREVPPAILEFSLYVFGFQKFDSGMPEYGFLVFILLRVYWASWVCGFMSFINFRNFSAIISFFKIYLFIFIFGCVGSLLLHAGFL